MKQQERSRGSRVKMKLRESLVVPCPYGRAPVYLDRYFEELEHQGRGPALLRLELPLEDLGIPGGAVIGRDVAAWFAPLTGRHTIGHFSEDESHFEHVTAVVWTPARGGPFPVFRGFLSVQTDEDYESCRLVLEGDYKPPFGIAGLTFDSIFGRRIARATARDLLRELGGVLVEAQRRETAPLAAKVEIV